jgi:hypothetical protein
MVVHELGDATGFDDDCLHGMALFTRLGG